MAYVEMSCSRPGPKLVTVMTAVVFSATDAVALLVTVGVSLTLVTVTARAWLSVLAPSETCTVTS